MLPQYKMFQFPIGDFFFLSFFKEMNACIDSKIQESLASGESDMSVG